MGKKEETIVESKENEQDWTRLEREDKMSGTKLSSSRLRVQVVVWVIHSRIGQQYKYYVNIKEYNIYCVIASVLSLLLSLFIACQPQWGELVEYD